MVPDYEVKLLLDAAAVLGADNKLTPEVLKAFEMPKTVTKMNVQFFDTNDKSLYTAGWSPRIRKTEGEAEVELTYKKRYPIDLTAATRGGIDGALATAKAEGFDSSDENFDAQVEWGYQKQTLSVSYQATAPGSEHSGIELPGQDESQEMLIKGAPSKSKDWKKHRGTEALGASRIYEPVLARRSTGRWGELKVYIEVWPIRDEAGTGIQHVVEASFKAKKQSKAADKQAGLVKFLTEREWFVPQDSLKTQLIMDRY